ncbi:hypothetical protein [Microseira wollei]|nr:hypothetical protein [Microseira wollei]
MPAAYPTRIFFCGVGILPAPNTFARSQSNLKSHGDRSLLPGKR